MAHSTTKRIIPEPTGLRMIQASAEAGELVVVIGTGVSLGLSEGKVPEASWSGLIEHGFSFAQRKGLISGDQLISWKRHIASPDIDELLTAAEFLGRKLEAPDGDLYARWLETALGAMNATDQPLSEAVLSLHKKNIPICTLNYDHLLESVTGLPSITLDETRDTTEWMRREKQGILHLHGSWRRPKSCILGIRDYQNTLNDQVRDLLQRNLGSFKRLLFIGCGETFKDPNLSALIKWLRLQLASTIPQHYALVTEGHVHSRNADPSWRGFLEPISFGSQHSSLASYITHITDNISIDVSPPSRSKSPRATFESRVLEEYLTFLVKDCGQMTIEGVRADMEIGQRRFDLERLFVPLKIAPCPPETKKSDRKAQEKLNKWLEKNGRSQPFGRVFSKSRRIALLALPGGGKTLLLKRLAVAYAASTRRTATDDVLPKLDLVPVLIRCREWRDHIRKPLVTLLKSLPEITGQPKLEGLVDALIPVFENGRGLLLIDGLDEIHSDADRSSFVDNLESFIDAYPQCRIVLTSREAGFSLVAPSLSRFCQRWRVAPLESDAVIKLCSHWRVLMSGDTPESKLEMQEVIDHLLRNPSLHRLAENPLLLTMLLVVRHGAGRLPPDRVSLYSRAVEVLLDTWNIKGHEPLNLKEAVPQLAYVALKLLKDGKQTATERQLLAILEEAREHIPHIQRYASDSPHEFLKRVELRSSLLLEAGHQIERNQTVPFYQFRHLTFQEYLAALAAVEGHYIGYSTRDTILKPLKERLLADEWKEVIPMSAVLARKQAEPLIVELIRQVRNLKLTADRVRKKKSLDIYYHEPRLPAAVSRLVQCLAEEAEASPATITAALRLVACFANGCDSDEDWLSLSRGPYGAELFNHSWTYFSELSLGRRMALNTCSFIALSCWQKGIIAGGKLDSDLRALLESLDEKEVARGIFIIAGSVTVRFRRRPQRPPIDRGVGIKDISVLEKLIESRSEAIATAAVWAWLLCRYHTSPKKYWFSPLDSIARLWINGRHDLTRDCAASALWTQFGMKRSLWRPILSEAEAEKVREHFGKSSLPPHHATAAVMVGFHAGNVWDNRELAKKIRGLKARDYDSQHRGREVLKDMLNELKKTEQNKGRRPSRRHAIRSPYPNSS